MITKKQTEEFIKMMKQAVFSSDNQVDDYSEPLTNLLNDMFKGSGGGDTGDLEIDCGYAGGDETE